MANSTNLQELVKHIVNGTFEHNFCRICLSPLEDLYEDVFTYVCKENQEYCVADVLEMVCRIRVCFFNSVLSCNNSYVKKRNSAKIR